MIGFSVQTVAEAFTAIARAAGGGKVAQLMAPHLKFNHDLRELKILESSVDCNVPLEQHTSLEAGTTLMPNGPGAVLAGVNVSPMVYETLKFLIYIFPPFNTPSYFLLVCIEQKEGWNSLGKYFVGWGSLSLVSGSLLNSVLEWFMGQGPFLPLPFPSHRDRTGSYRYWSALDHCLFKDK